jgi:hypothetical protein
MQNVGYISAARVGSDYGEGRSINAESYFYPATFVINRPDFWTSHRYASSNMAGTYYTHGRLYINDSGNVLTLDKPIPLSEAQIVATIFGISGGPVMLGDDIDRIAEDRLALIRKVFPRTPEIATPLDLFDRPEPDYPHLFHLPVETAWGRWDVLAVLNYADDPLTLPVLVSQLGLDPAGTYRVWEFWNEQYLGTLAEELRAVVAPKSVRLYRIAALTEHPWVLGTDMHVMQGQTELTDVRWDAETMTLSGKAMRPAGETGNLFVHAPKGLCVTHPEGLWIAKDGRDETLVIRVQLQFGDEPVDWSVRFARFA